MDSQQIKQALPEEARDLVDIVEKDNRFEVTHGYIEDAELYNKIRDVIRELGGSSGGWRGDKLAHHSIPKGEGQPKGVVPHVVAGDKSKPLQQMNVIPVAVDKLVMSEFWARQSVDKEKLQELAESIREKGVQQNLKARWKGDKLEIVFGHRRVLAARRAGLTHVPVVIENVSDEEAFLLQWDENEQHEDVSDMDKARFLNQMKEKFNLTHEQLAERIGRNRVWVTRHLAMLEIEDNVPRGTPLETGDLTERQARELLKATPEQREEILEQAQEKGKLPSARTIRDLTQLRQCDAPGCVTRTDVKEWNNHGIYLCPHHRKDADERPQRYLHIKKTEETVKKLEKARILKPKTEVKDTWEYRKERMKVRRSKFEDRFDVLASQAGLPYGESNVDVCLLGKNVDKVYQTPQGSLYVEFDGPPHKGKENHDAELRDKLRRKGKVLEIQYQNASDKAVQDAIRRVQTKLEEMGVTKEALG